MTFKNPHYLRDTQWLEEHLSDPDLRILDVTGRLNSKFQNLAKEKCYDLGHIPGAEFLDVAGGFGELSSQGAPLPWTFPDRAQIESVMGRLGVNNRSQVVIYAGTPRPGIDNGTMWATRTWWVLHHYGVQCAVLDGGWEKWIAEGRPVSTEPGSYPGTTFMAASGWERGLATKEDLLGALESNNATCILNALSAESFAGTDPVVYGPRKGHITGTVSLPMNSLLDGDDGTFVSAEAMRRHFGEAGALSAEKVITYCGGGIAATVDAFALALLGHEQIAVYDNSLIEWSADPSLPMTDPSEDA